MFIKKQRKKIKNQNNEDSIRKCNMPSISIEGWNWKLLNLLQKN